jgi:hypothetical protein
MYSALVTQILLLHLLRQARSVENSPHPLTPPSSFRSDSHLFPNPRTLQNPIHSKKSINATMSFVAMTQQHCDASVVRVKSKRSDSSILSHIDDRLQRVINRTKSAEEPGKSRRIRPNLGRKRASVKSYKRRSILTDNGFNNIGDTLIRGEEDDSMRRTPSTARNSSDPDNVSISDFPAPPGCHRQVTVEERTSADNTLVETDDNGAVHELEPLVDRLALEKPPAVHSIDLMIASYPHLQVELNTLKKVILEHEKEIMASNDRVERQLDKRLVNALLKNDQLQESVNEKEAFMSEVYKELDKHEDQLDQSAAELSEAYDRIRWLEHEVDRLASIAHRTQRELTQKIGSHSREKRQLIEEWEAQVLVEKRKSKDIAQAKELGVSFNDRTKQNHAFYRNFFNQQQQLYRTYFGQYGQEKGITPSEAGMGGFLSIPVISESLTSDGDGRDGEENMSKYIISALT